VSEPDPDRGDIDGAGVHVLAFVVAAGDGSEGLEFVDAAFDDVALLVAQWIERRRAPATSASTGPVGLLIGRFGDGRGDASPAQAGPDSTAGVRLVGQHPARASAGTAEAAPADTDTSHDRPEHDRVVALPCGHDPGDRSAASVCGQVDLRGQPATRTPQRFSNTCILIMKRVRRSPLCGAGPRACGARLQRADVLWP